MFGSPYRTVLGTVRSRRQYQEFLVKGQFSFLLNPFNNIISTLHTSFCPISRVRQTVYIDVNILKLVHFTRLNRNIFISKG